MAPSPKIPDSKGWYPCPYMAGKVLRFFDGAKWTEETRKPTSQYEPQKQHQSDDKDEVKSPAWQNPNQTPALTSGDEEPPKAEEKPAKEEPKQEEPAEKKTAGAPMFAKPATAKKEEPKKPKFKLPTEFSEPEDNDDKPAAPAGGFAKPAVKAEKKDDEEPAPQKPAAPPSGFAKPSVKAEKSEEDQDEAPKQEPPKNTAPAGFAKPATNAAKAEEDDEPAPQLNEQKTPFVESSPGVDDRFGAIGQDSHASYGAGGFVSSDEDQGEDMEEDSDSINASFGAAPPEAPPEFTSDSLDAAPKKSKKFSLPQLPGLPEIHLNAKVITWLVTLGFALAVLLAALFIPAPLRGIVPECEPISDVMGDFFDSDDYSIEPDQQADLAAAVSGDRLADDVESLVRTAVDEDDMQPVAEYCFEGNEE